MKDKSPYAVIAIGGNQVTVSPGATVRVDEFAGVGTKGQEAEVGSTVTLSDVLLINDESGVKVGSPTLSGASVSAKLLGRVKSPKVMLFKKRRRHGYTKKQGHRQQQVDLLIESING